MATFNNTEDVSQLWNNLGTFYSALPKESKAIINTYWSAMLSGLEGIYKNLAQSYLSGFINKTSGYIQIFDKKIELNKEDLLIIHLTKPAVTGAPAVHSGTTAIYSYKVSAVDESGGESFLSNPVIIYAGSTDLVTYPNTLNWSAIPGAVKYKIYGRTAGVEELIGDTVNLTFTDNGSITPDGEMPNTDSSILYYLFKLPDDFFYLSIPTIKLLFSNLLLTEGTDYIIQDLQWIKFLNPHSLTFLKNIDKEDLYMVDGLYINPLLINLYGKAFAPDNLIKDMFIAEKYLPWVKTYSTSSFFEQKKQWLFHIKNIFNGLHKTLISGPTMGALKNTLGFLLNIPFSYTAGTVTDVTAVGNFYEISISSNGVTTIYKIPNSFTPAVEANDVVEKYQFLGNLPILSDYISDSTLIENNLVAWNINSYEKYFTLVIEIPAFMQNLGKWEPFIETFYEKIMPPNLKIILN